MPGRSSAPDALVATTRLRVDRVHLGRATATGPAARTSVLMVVSTWLKFAVRLASWSRAVGFELG